MKGDFSRLTFDKKKHYNAVLMQQGRVQLDADWNEQQAINQHRNETEACDVIGQSGAPKDDAGFEIKIQNDKLFIGKGKYYVDGILCENDKEVAYKDNNDAENQQPDLPEPTDILDLLKKANATGGLVYLDVWKRHITALDDVQIREKALSGPDTTTRIRTIWQVKVLPLTSSQHNTTFKTSFPEWINLLKTSDGTLNAKTRSSGRNDKDRPCFISSAADYRGLENQLYRVEIHRGSKDQNGTEFKWSRDNGSVIRAIEKIEGPKITVDTTGKDTALSFKNEQWVEILDDRDELNGRSGELIQIDMVNDATREISLKSAPSQMPNFDKKWHPKLRLWDSDGEMKVEIPASNEGWIQIENGIEVKFSNGSYKTSDYWLIPARTAIADIEWPEDNSKNPIPQKPHVVEHHYCPLAIIKIDDDNKITKITDCRKLFPSLTNITACDVSYDNSASNLLDAKTVQEAIDELCKNRRGSCTYTPTPTKGWETVFDSIKDGEDAQICFPVGIFLLDKSVIVKKKGNIKIVGSGKGTVIQAFKSESTLNFEDCTSVDVRDLSIESGTVGSGKEVGRYLNGALTFFSCTNVSVENVEVKCASGMRLSASCITVRDAPTYDRKAEGTPITPVSSVRVRDCRLLVGNQQVGLLLVNAVRAHIENNEIIGAEKTGKVTFAELLREKRFRAMIRKGLISNTYIGKKDPEQSELNATVSFGGHRVRFKTEKVFEVLWQKVIDANPPSGIDKPAKLLAHINKVADAILLSDGAFEVGGARPFKGWYDGIEKGHRSVASQGIVCCGQRADEIRIQDNTLRGILQGIHVGMSHREARKGTPDMAGRVFVYRNTISLTPIPSVLEHHGIYVGNCDSLFIEHNYVDADRSGKKELQSVKGIKIAGYIGRIVIVRENHLTHLNPGIGIEIISRDRKGNSQWLVAYNMIPNCPKPVDASGFISIGNLS